MTKRKLKGTWLTLTLVLVLVLAACGNKEKNNAGSSDPVSESPSATTSSEPSESASSVDALKGKKIALVMRFNTGTFSAHTLMASRSKWLSMAVRSRYWLPRMICPS